MIGWMLFVAVGCMEHTLHPATVPEDALLYQARVLDFMCSETCEWQEVDSCWEDLSGHWAFCADGSEWLDPGLVERCGQHIDTLAGSDECVYLPEECLLSSVVLSPRGDCAVAKGL